VELTQWWKRYPGRFEFEIRQLEANDILCEVDHTALAEGIAVLNLTLDIGDYFGLKIQVVFPDNYPMVPFQAYAPDLSLPHHIQPFNKNICFLDDPGNSWRCDDTVANILVHQLPKVLDAGSDTNKNDLEAQRSEPITNYLRFSSGSMVCFDSAWSIPSEIVTGRLVIGSNEPFHHSIFRGAVIEVKDKDDGILVRAEENITEGYGKRLAGRWVRFSKPPNTNNIAQIYEMALAVNSHLKKPLSTHGGFDIIGILFQEETKWRETGDSWMFLVRTVKNNKATPFMLVRGGRSGRQDLQGRNPVLRGMEEKKVALFGLGCLGAPSALEFAKNGIGKLMLLDDDYVEPGTIVRWPYGLQMAAGHDKSIIIKSVIDREYPYTDASAFVARLGNATWPNIDPPGLRERDVLRMMFEDANLIYDATADFSINNMLAMLAYEQRVTYISIAGTPGMWGGSIIRIRPGEGEPCWNCVWNAVNDGTIPSPKADIKNGIVAPDGCTAPTFTGTSFDASEISMGGVRLAVSTLMEGATGGYPKTEWDVAIIDLRDSIGNMTPPHWQTFKLQRHHACQCSKGE
jgi:hypothetical protein